MGFINTYHDGSGFKSIMEYLALLSKVDIHKALDEYQKLSKQQKNDSGHDIKQ